MTVIDLGVPSLGPVHPAPADGPLVDTFGRIATDLRVSLTDRCNLRCTYCMPAEGLDWLPGEQLLTPAELIRLLRIAVTRLGITSVRFTGGEPLVAKNLDDIVAATAGLRPRPEITLTTNGVGLAKRAVKLKDAGLDRINVSLDTVDAARFSRITRRDRLNDVLEGLAAAKAAGLNPVKVNAVLDPVTGLDDAVELLRFCVEHGYQLRIIEQMPLDADHQWQRGKAVGADDVLAVLRQHFDLTPNTAPRGSAPAELWRVDGDRGLVGIIASVSHAFCAACDRTRLTADGQVRNCLFATQETDLRHLMRTGADDDTLEAAWRAAMWAKAAGHGINDPDFVQPDRPMSAIGG
ncbi:GTP 3',8-cyclase MoaA [Mycobacterium sp. NPDC051804]|uniref:GTP 3',8-cyclase MoaA n=1 Tax=Mycobacterium sp. NPDC051804 TaxID=3364295 RepID=UPI0037914D88